ncbi:MAG: RdgB/HAM1 family non-canonical purine NTP pyrophosphatase [Lachnospiraceae bacterium]|nr:RdgB/HAM1 family non-canonical purine NTP pyrophosphatase [Lachnospiraceae bacterium]
MENRIIFATGNEGKMREIRMILADIGLPVVCMKEAGITADIEENGKSFAENAAIKAKAIMEMTGEIVMADDSGLEIDYLDGAPGIYSARFMGEDTSYDIKNTAILEKLQGVPEEKRTARFVCAIACVLPDGQMLQSYGTMEGIIGYEIRGGNGFGYDPIFYLPECGCTSAEIAPEKKNELSHRGKALRQMKALLQEHFDGISEK